MKEGFGSLHVDMRQQEFERVVVRSRQGSRSFIYESDFPLKFKLVHPCPRSKDFFLLPEKARRARVSPIELHLLVKKMRPHNYSLWRTVLQQTARQHNYEFHLLQRNQKTFKSKAFTWYQNTLHSQSFRECQSARIVAASNLIKDSIMLTEGFLLGTALIKDSKLTTNPGWTVSWSTTCLRLNQVDMVWKCCLVWEDWTLECSASRLRGRKSFGLITLFVELDQNCEQTYSSSIEA